jgi:hypothetical protein
MATIVLRNCYVKLNGKEYNAKSAAISVDTAAPDATDFGSDGWNEIAKGLKSWGVELQIKAAYGSGSIDADIWEILMSTDLVPIEIRPTSDAVSTANPSWTGSVIMTKYKIGGGVGEVAMAPISLQGSGALSRNTGA